MYHTLSLPLWIIWSAHLTVILKNKILKLSHWKRQQVGVSTIMTSSCIGMTHVQRKGRHWCECGCSEPRGSVRRSWGSLWKQACLFRWGHLRAGVGGAGGRQYVCFNCSSIGGSMARLEPSRTRGPGLVFRVLCIEIGEGLSQDFHLYILDY